MDYRFIPLINTRHKLHLPFAFSQLTTIIKETRSIMNLSLLTFDQRRFCICQTFLDPRNWITSNLLSYYAPGGQFSLDWIGALFSFSMYQLEHRQEHTGEHKEQNRQCDNWKRNMLIKHTGIDNQGQVKQMRAITKEGKRQRQETKPKATKLNGLKLDTGDHQTCIVWEPWKSLANVSPIH